MRALTTAALFLFLLAGCAESGVAGSNSTGRCLYAVEMDFGQMLKWGSCTTPPPRAIRRIGDDS